MACERFAGQLKDVAAGGELAPNVAEHLEQCAACRQALAKERRVVASIDADVMQAVRVEPSADFDARLRMRVASEPATAKWFGSWRLAAAVASLAVIALVLTVILVRREAVHPAQPQAVAGTPSAHGAERAAVQPVVPPTRNDVGATEPIEARSSERTARVRGSATPHPKEAALREPEVLVARDQQVVIARLLEILRRGKLDEKALEQPSEAPPTPGPIVVGELTVAPIVVAPTGNEKQ